ncbi:MAG: tetratricopeptide repeat protein [bacterium]
MRKYKSKSKKKLIRFFLLFALSLSTYLVIFRYECMKGVMNTRSALTFRREENNEVRVNSKTIIAGESGDEEEKDRAKAMEMLSKAYDRSIAISEFNQGIAYLTGKGIDTNLVEAEKCFRKSAELGHPLAQFQLGTAYLSGLGVETNPAEAVKWFRLSAEQGAAVAQYNLGVALERGEGVPQDNQAAYGWFIVAKDRGFTPSILKVESLEKLLSPSQIQAQKDWAIRWKSKILAPSK